MVGHKNVFPSPYTVDAAKITISPCDVEPSQNKPAAPNRPLRNNKPSGLIRSTMGPAKNRNTNIMLEVQMNTSMAFS